MKRLIPASIILISLITICIYSHFYINKICKQTASEIEKYRNQTISASVLQNNWKNRKDKMSIFVNRGFLDEISIYMGQLTVTDTPDDSAAFDATYVNILTVLSMINEEQQFGLHSFY